MNRLLSIAAMLLPLLLAPASTAAQAPDIDALRAELREAYAANDGERLVSSAERLLETFSGHPGYQFYVARGKALLGDQAGALAVLHSIAGRGVDLLEHVIDDAAFDELRESAGFPALSTQVAALRQPVGEAVRAWRFGDPDSIPESVAIAADGRVLLGSVRKREILVRDSNGDVTRWRDPAFWSVQGIHFSADGRSLWVATSAMAVTLDIDAAERGRSALLELDGRSGELLGSYPMGGGGEHVLGDFIFLDDVTLLASDSVGGGLYSLDVRTGQYTERVAPGRLRSPQGLARLGNFVYVADYANGLYRFDPGNDELARVADGPTTPYGIDGLYVHRGALIAIQNGLSPHRVARYSLAADGLEITSQEILLANHPDFGEPTLGQVLGDRLYFVANSQWNRVSGEGQLAAEGLAVPVVLALQLVEDQR